MEVHHHSHTVRKKWTHYFWEFLMLFLAVFCGFLAENQREHYIEHQRERQYMNSMLEDLKNDTFLLADCVAFWNNINSSLDSVSDAIQFPMSQADLIKAYRHLNNGLNYYGFGYNERTIAQLKNSGGFRMIRQKEVANKIILYDRLNMNAVDKIDDQHTTLYMQTLALRNKVFVQEIINEVFKRCGYKQPLASDNIWIDSMIKGHEIPPAPEAYNTLMFEFKNSLLALRKDFSNMKWGYDRLQEMQNELIKLIQEKYNLE